MPVTGEQLRTLMDIRRPDAGGELRRIGASGEAVAALDATFSEAKSVSAAWALGSPGCVSGSKPRTRKWSQWW